MDLRGPFLYLNFSFLLHQKFKPRFPLCIIPVPHSIFKMRYIAITHVLRPYPWYV